MATSKSDVKIDKAVQNVASNPDENWTGKVLALYGQGRKDLAICKELGMTKRQFEMAINSSSGFKDMVEFGRELSQNFWEEQSRLNLENKEFNTTLYKMHMQQFHGWSDKAETKGSQTLSASDIDKLKHQVVDRLPELMKLVEGSATSVTKKLENVDTDND
jgi:hypothetical protein